MDSKLIRGGSTFFAQAPRRLKAVPTPKAPAFVSGRSKFRSCRLYRYRLDRTKPVPPVHTEHGDQQGSCHRHTTQRDKCAEQHREAAHQLCHDGQPRHQVRGRHSQNVKDGGERLGPFEELGIPCSMKPNPTIRRNGIGAQVAPATHS